jgi:hypothetical protein
MLRFSTAALLIAATLACSGLRQTLKSGAGYKAKELASRVFVSGREAERVIPSRKLVLVRLGQSRPESSYSSNDFGAAVLAAIGE